MQTNRFMNNRNKPSKRYRLYCPNTPSDISKNGYGQFKTQYLKCEENTLEHLIRIGEMMEWYQIVDIRDNYKVVKEIAPI